MIRIISDADIRSHIIPQLTIASLLRSQAVAFLSLLPSSSSSSSSSSSCPPSPSDLAQCPTRLSLSTPWHTQLFMPARTSPLEGGGSVIKCVSVPKPPLSGIAGVNLLFSDTTGQVTHVVNSTCLTAIRTAAGSLLSSVVALGVVKGTVKRVVVFGDGAQAVFHLWLHLRYFTSIQNVVVAVGTHRELTPDQLTEKQSSFLTLLESLPTSLPSPRITFLNAKIQQHQVQQAVNKAQLIFTCTPSTQPLFGDLERFGGDGGRRHICAVGSYKPSMCELPPGLVRHVCRDARLLVDSKEACIQEAGCLLQALGTEELNALVEIATLLPSTEAGKVEEQEWLKEVEKRAEMWEPDRAEGEAGWTSVFKSVGVGLQDVEMTKLVVAVAGQGVGCMVGF
ncbi:uncharacterized protein UTRI_03410_B [Ustilago trichophora]|uniref:Ornithine cyclodeaminase n=1 Tax=Ustilago trichophora TaxID=86804 RepID=A0A5C3E148_9BASI|nr:uncharacterized protein UTRI_03410_B [Ustilago trichophora]